MKNGQRIAGKRAQRETIKPSQKNYAKKLQKRYPESIVLQGAGVPDIIVVTKNVKLYEIKPTNGKIILNQNQNSMIKNLLSKGTKNIFMVYYKKDKNKFKYSEVKLNYRTVDKFSDRQTVQCLIKNFKYK